MDNYNGYKLKPKECSIQPNDVIIRVIPGSSQVLVGSIAIALEGNRISMSHNKNWTTEYSDWRAIETKPGQKAVAGDTVYCIKNTGGACSQHDSFRITDHSNRNYISPEKGHILLNGTITGQGWNWKAIDFIVLVKADSKELQEFPCFRRGIVGKNVVKFESPKRGTIVFTGESQFDLGHTSNTWVDYNNTSVWEPCEDPALSHTSVDPYKAKPGDYVEWADNSTPTSMTKGHLYKVLKVLSPTVLSILNNCNKEDVWLKERFKRVSDKPIQEFPCFRRAIRDGHVVKFISPNEGSIIISGNSYYDIKYTSNTWVDYNDTSVWEPCSDPREIEEVTPVVVDPYKAKPGDYVEWADESTPSLSMTKGQLYKVINADSSGLVLLNNHNHRDFWKKLRFKRVPDKAIQDPVLISSDDHIDALAYALRIPISYISIDSMMHKPTPVDTATISIVPVDSMMNKPTHPKQNSKGKQMNSNLFTDILKLLTQTEQTDLEKAPSTYAFFYNNEGEYEGTARVANETEAKALLQKPEHLGYTMRIYTFSDEFTTQIPVVSTIKKTVVAKPARKPRATKAI